MTPLRVVYPHGGRVFLLHWWTYDDRGHMIVSPTWRGLAETAKRVFMENPDAEIKACQEIVLVAPGEHLQTLAARQVMEQQIGSFFFEMTLRMRDVAEAGKPIPAPFERCAKYERDEEDGPVDPADEWSISRHSGCINCQDSIRLLGMTKGDLYARYYARWLALHPDAARREPREDKRRVPSRARVAKTGEPLWRVCANFGPHSKGLVIEEMRVEGEHTLFSSSLGYSSLEDEALFFFVPIQDLNVSDLQAMLDTRKAAAAHEQKLREQMRKDEFARNAVAEIEDTIAFFKESL